MLTILRGRTRRLIIEENKVMAELIVEDNKAMMMDLNAMKKFQVSDGR
jgi:hypothetical protein